MCVKKLPGMVFYCQKIGVWNNSQTMLDSFGKDDGYAIHPIWRTAL